MKSALHFIRRHGCRRYSFKVTQFPTMPCPPDMNKVHPCPVAKDVPLPQEQVDMCERTCQLRSMDPCWTPARPKPPKAPKVPFRSMWETSIDEEINCPDEPGPRFDALYYHPKYDSRRVQRTWVECPPVNKRVRKVCCLDGIEPPEVLYRVKERCPDLCTVDYKRLRALCMEEELLRDHGNKCKKTYWPCCKKLGRCNPSCKKIREKTICSRLRAPYPSFSERPRDYVLLRSSECRCHDFVPKCVALRVKTHRENIDMENTACWSEAMNAGCL